MSKETELKLRLHSSAVERLTALLNTLAQARGNSTLNNRYLDTPSAALAQAKAALRIREKNGAFEQTLKTRGTSVAGLHQRGEWNWPLSSAALDASLLVSDEVKAHWPAAIDPTQLGEVFATNFERSAWLYEHNGSSIEVVIDLGSVQTANARLPLCEVELELVTGDAAALWQLAVQLGAEVPLFLSDISKAERGYRLANLSRPWSDVVSFAKQDDLAKVMPQWLQYEHQQFQRALEAALWDQDVEAALTALHHFQALRQLPQLAGKAYKRRDTKVLREALDLWQQPLNNLAVLAQLQTYLNSADAEIDVKAESKAAQQQWQQLLQQIIANAELANALTQAAQALHTLPVAESSGETAGHWLRHLLQQQAPLLQRLHDQRPQDEEQWRGRRHDMQLLRQSCDYLRAQPSLSQGLGINGQGVGEGSLRVLSDMLNAQTLLQRPWPLAEFTDSEGQELRSVTEYSEWALEHLMVLARQL